MMTVKRLISNTINNFSWKKYRILVSKWLEHQKDFTRREINSSIINNPIEYDIDQLYETIHKEAEPVFVLSTGRCGTKLLTRIFQLNKNLKVAHEPYPVLGYYSAYAYSNYKSSGMTLKKIIDACRYEIIRDCFLLSKEYIESNHHITFFAFQIAELFPGSRFVHLERDPIAFIESAYSRNWYQQGKVSDEGRIRPVKEEPDKWKDLSQVQMIAWLWCETNQFIEKFGQKYPARTFKLKSEDLYSNPHRIGEMFEFLSINIPVTGKIKQLLRKPVNAQPASKRRKVTETELKHIGEIISQYAN